MATDMTLLELMAKFPMTNPQRHGSASSAGPTASPSAPTAAPPTSNPTAARRTMTYRCREKGCAKRFSIKTATVMQSSKLGPGVWASAHFRLALLACGSN